MPPSQEKTFQILELWDRLLKTEDRLRKSEGDEAQVHKFRVRSRRLAMVSSLHPELEKNPKWKQVLKKVRELRRRLGEVREIDVHLNLWREVAAASPSRDSILKFFAEQRNACLKKLLPKIRLKQVGPSLLSKLQNAGAVSPHSASAKQVTKRFKKVFRSQRRFENKRRPEALHRVRIALKKLRYSLEPLKEQLGPRGGHFLAWLKLMQDELGRVHDLATLQDAIRKCPKDKALRQVTGKIQAAIELGKSRWQKTWNERQKQFRAFMLEFGSPESAGAKKAKP